MMNTQGRDADGEVRELASICPAISKRKIPLSRFRTKVRMSASARSAAGRWDFRDDFARCSFQVTRYASRRGEKHED
jgi:hypothetical protein